MIYLKKAKLTTMIGIIVVTALVILIAGFSNVVNASGELKNEETSAVSTENKTTKKERKGKKGSSEKKTKFENLTDEEKEALKAERKAKYESMTDEEKEALKAKKETRKAKFENMTDEEKEALKNKKPEKKERKNNNAVNSQNAEQ